MKRTGGGGRECFRFLDLRFPDTLFPRIWVPNPCLETLRVYGKYSSIVFLYEKDRIPLYLMGFNSKDMQNSLARRLAKRRGCVAV
jgi:hypothetical protein